MLLVNANIEIPTAQADRNGLIRGLTGFPRRPSGIIRNQLFLRTLLSECVTDRELADAVEALSRLRQVKTNCILFRQGEPPSRLFLLRAGEVVLTSRLADKSVLGLRAAPGSLIGLRAIAGGQPYSMTAKVTKNSDLHVISFETFREIVGCNPCLALRVIQVLASEGKSARVLASSTLSSVAS